MARQLESGHLELQFERLSTEAIYSSLFARDLDFPLQCIFLSLDPVSLKNSRLVCIEWSDFIRGRVWGTTKGSEPNSRLRQRLAYHWIHATPTAKSVVLQLDNPVYSLSCDDSVVVCGMEGDSAKVYDLVNLNLLAVLDPRPPPQYQPPAGVNNFGNVVGYVSVWRKSDWSTVFKECLHGNNYVTHEMMVMDLRTGQHVKCIDGYSANALDGCTTSLHHNKNILVGSVLHKDRYSMQQSVYFCDLQQITNPQQKEPHWKRRKYLEDGIINMVSVNTSCVVAAQGNKLHVWDFWDCDDFNDTPGHFINDVEFKSSDSVEFSDNQDGWSDSFDVFSDNSGDLSDN